MQNQELFAETSSTPPITFEWGNVIEESGMKGLSAMLARHTEVKKYDAGALVLDLEINDQIKLIAEDGILDEMTVHLRTFFGPSLVVRESYGPAAGSLSADAQKSRVCDMADIMTSMMDDQFITDMVREFGASVFIDSITKNDVSATPAPALKVRP